MWLELKMSAGSRNQRKTVCHWVTVLRSVQWEMGVRLPSASDAILPRLVLLAGAHYPPCYSSDPWAGNRRKSHNDWSWPCGSDLWDNTASYLNWSKMENYCYLYSEGESNTPGGGRAEWETSYHRKRAHCGLRPSEITRPLQRAELYSRVQEQIARWNETAYTYRYLGYNYKEIVDCCSSDTLIWMRK